MNLRKIIPLFLIAMSFTVVTPALASFEAPVTKTETVDQPSQEFIYKSHFTKQEKKAFKEEKRERKNEKKKNNGIIFGLGILGVAVVVLLLIWIF